MDHAEQALAYIDKCSIYIFANGSLLDQAKLHYLYAKCLHLLNRTKSKLIKHSFTICNLNCDENSIIKLNVFETSI